MSTNVIKRTPAAGGPSYNPGGPFYVPPQGQYGQRDRDFHVGVDYAAPAGTPIPAASSGEVVYSGPSGGFHYAVIVKSTSPNGHDHYYSIYGHVDPASAPRAGTMVSIGQSIGAVGALHDKEGELSTGPHVHFGITTGEKLKEFAGIKELPVHGSSGGLGFFTSQSKLFENPNEFKGWTLADKAPYNALTYVPIRDGVAYQPVPHLAQTQQGNQLFSAANSFNPPGLSPAEINRFYTETGNPSTDPSGSLGNGVSRPAANPKMAVGISPAEIDRLYNFTQLGRSATTPSTANGITPLNQTTSVPWYSSPAVAGNYAPTDNFSWNNVPTGIGNRGPSPATGPAGAPSPAIRAPQNDRRSAAPDDTAWTSAQGAASAAPAYQQDAAYSPTGDFFGNFPRAAAVATAPSPLAFNDFRLRCPDGWRFRCYRAAPFAPDERRWSVLVE